MDKTYTDCWDPNGASQVIQTHIDKDYGIILLVKQLSLPEDKSPSGYIIIPFNNNEQRLVYGTSKKEFSIREILEIGALSDKETMEMEKLVEEEKLLNEERSLDREIVLMRKLSNRQIGRKLMDRREKERRQRDSYVESGTIDVLIKHMELQVQNPLQDQRYHWAEVSKPFSIGEPPTTVPELDSNITRRVIRNPRR